MYYFIPSLRRFILKRKRDITKSFAPAIAKRLQILNLLFNDFVSRNFVPFFTLYICFLGMGSLYGTFRAHGFLPLYSYLMFPCEGCLSMFIMIVCLPQCARVHIGSVKLRQLLRREIESKVSSY